MYHRTYTNKFIFDILFRIIVWTLHVLAYILIYSSTACTPFSGLQCLPVVCSVWLIFVPFLILFFVIIYHLFGLFFSVHTYIGLCAITLEFAFLFSLKLVSSIFIKFSFFQQMIVLQKLRKMLFFIKKTNFIPKIFQFVYFHHPLFFSLSAIALGSIKN